MGDRLLRNPWRRIDLYFVIVLVPLQRDDVCEIQGGSLDGREYRAVGRSMDPSGSLVEAWIVAMNRSNQRADRCQGRVCHVNSYATGMVSLRQLSILRHCRWIPPRLRLSGWTGVVLRYCFG